MESLEKNNILALVICVQSFFLILLGWEIRLSLRSMFTLKRGYGMNNS